MNLVELYKDQPIDLPVAKRVAKYQVARNDADTKIYTMQDQADSHTKALRSMNAFLRRKGWKLLGSGAYSLVYINLNEPFILKINKRQDQGFAWFALLTHKFPNKHFPKITAMRGVNIDGRFFHIYAIEKLVKIPQSDVAYLCRDIADSDIGITGDSEVAALAEYMPLEEAKSLFNACLILRKHNPRHFHVDLHYDNIMQRKDGTVVINDPFSGSGWR